MLMESSRSNIAFGNTKHSSMECCPVLVEKSVRSRWEQAVFQMECSECFGVWGLGSGFGSKVWIQ